ncbi:MAG: hypothetical protein IPJ03_19780 [Ignavibacteriales bacterium]|nr:hypothetical protein [Ignavibacteriales bacterium]
MNKLHRVFAVSFFIAIILCGCGGGIEPAIDSDSSQPEGFSGAVVFVGAWPDSAKRTHIVVFRDPLDSVADFNIFNLSFVSQEIPYGAAFYAYTSLDTGFVPVGGLIPAGEYSYVCVAQSFSEEVSFDRKDWVVAGIYYAEGDSANPGKLIIPQGQLVTNINIKCDFDNLPPQPPGGN